MSQQYNSGFCKHCNEQVRTQRESPNHILHFLITILTCGFWVIIWFLLCLLVDRWSCSKCGQKISGNIIYYIFWALIGFIALFIIIFGGLGGLTYGL